jgi:hypothetical protein
MAGLSQYAQQELLDHMLKTGAWTAPTNIYVALFTATPSDTGGGTEVSGVNYGRIICNGWDAATAASPSLAHNTAAINFATPGAGGWGTVTHFALFDSLSAGTNLLGWGALGTPKAINQNDTVSFAAGALDVTLD